MIKVRGLDVGIVHGDIAALRHGALAIDANDRLLRCDCVDEHAVRRACADVLCQADRNGMPSVALAAFGCGAGRFPVIGCAKIISQEILRVARDADKSMRLKEIVICLPTQELVDLFQKQVYGYLRHVMEDLAWGPYVCADIIIEVGQGIILIERTNPPFGWALPGGFVDNGESLETAARREAREETHMELEGLRQLHTYSDPSRDPRFHTITTVFVARGIGEPHAGDDAKGLQVVPIDGLRQMALAFDHNKVIADYLDFRGL